MIKKIINKIKAIFLNWMGMLGIRKYVNLIIYKGSKHKCPFCSHSFKEFLPTGAKLAVLKEKKVVGGGYRLNAICPYCHSSDRERLTYLFMKGNKLTSEGTKLLHFAPEKNLQKALKKENINYSSADLGSNLAEKKTDIRKIEFPSDHFDAIICNHVLEHVIEDKKAISELYRVLKPGGWAILQVPHSLVLDKTFEDQSIVGEKEREKAFGQFNHVRIYGADYINRLQSAGFKVEKKKLDQDTTQKFALNSNEMIFFCRKQMR